LCRLHPCASSAVPHGHSRFVAPSGQERASSWIDCVLPDREPGLSRRFGGRRREFGLATSPARARMVGSRSTRQAWSIAASVACLDRTAARAGRGHDDRPRSTAVDRRRPHSAACGYRRAVPFRGQPSLGQADHMLVLGPRIRCRSTEAVSGWAFRASAATTSGLHDPSARAVASPACTAVAGRCRCSSSWRRGPAPAPWSRAAARGFRFSNSK